MSASQVLQKHRSSSEEKLMQTFGSVLSSIRSEGGGGSSGRLLGSGSLPRGTKHSSNDLIDTEDASSDDASSDDTSSSASSLNEEEIRDVVRQVLVMVKHNRRSGSSATRTPSHSVDSIVGRGSSEAVAYFTVPSSGRGSPVAADPHHSASMSLVRGGHTSADGSGAPVAERKLLRSANVSTYASMVGIVRKPRSTTPDPPPVLCTQRSTVGAGGGGAQATAHADPAATSSSHPATPRAAPPSAAGTITTCNTSNSSAAIRFSKKRSGAAGPTSPGNPTTAWGTSTPKGKGTMAARPKLNVRSPTTQATHAQAPSQLPSNPIDDEHQGGASLVAHDDVSVQTADQQNRSLVEQRRVERLQRQRDEAMRDETFTPRTSRDANDIPETIRNVPLRAKGHWEDRLYTEYHSRKQQRALECEALRIAKATQQEIEEALDECSFVPDIRGIHNQLQHFKKNSPALRGDYNTSAASSRGGSRSGSAVALGNRERAAATTERLYGNTVMKAQAREDAAREYAARLEREAAERKEKLAEAKPSHTQLRLYEEHVRRKEEHARLVEEQRERMRANAFVFNIKGNYYETLPLPRQSDPGSFERLYHDGQRRNDKRSKAQSDALARRPSPTPLISPFAQRRVHSAQPVYERLAHAKPQRSVSPAVMAGGGGSTRRQQSLLTVTAPPQQSTAGAMSPLHSDAFHALATQGGARSEFIIHWMGRNSASVSRQNSMGKDAAVTPPPAANASSRPAGASPVHGAPMDGPTAHDSEGQLPSPRPAGSNAGSSRPASPIGAAAAAAAAAHAERRQSSSPLRPLEPERFVEVSSDSASSSASAVDDDEDDDLALVVAKKATVARLPVSAH